MVDVPAAVPSTTPLLLPMAATEVLLLVHVPPPVPLLSAVVLPTHTDRLPVMEVDSVLTVMVFIAVQARPGMVV